MTQGVRMKSSGSDSNDLDGDRHDESSQSEPASSDGDDPIPRGVWQGTTH